MEPQQAIILCAAFFVVATLYTTVGHAGASGYLAMMALVGLAPETMRPMALTLNILVAAFTVYRFRQARFFHWSGLWPFLLGSVPFAAVVPAGDVTWLRSWTYAESMPRVDVAGFELGLTPVAQWLVVPPLFEQTARFADRAPEYAAEYEGLRSTQSYVADVLGHVLTTGATTHLEIETYTWDVLPAGLKLDLLDSIARLEQYQFHPPIEAKMAV